MNIIFKKEHKISNYIDTLNHEKKPKEHEEELYFGEDQEMERLRQTIRQIRSLKEADMPGEEFSKTIVSAMKNQDYKKEKVIKKNVNETRGKRRKIWIACTAAAAVLFCVFFAVQIIEPIKETNIVYAMEKAYEKVKAYHGTLEIKTINGLGEETLQKTLEIWAHKNGTYYVKEIEGSNKNLITANNGEKKWQIREAEKDVYVYQAFPDSYFFTLELENELKGAKNAATIDTIEEETIAGRQTLKIRITPRGGKLYYLWIDKETNLPLQRQSSEQNGIIYKTTYASIEYLEEIPQELMDYSFPSDYTEIFTSQEQLVNTLEEVNEIVGFLPKILTEGALGYKISSFGAEPLKQISSIYYESEENKKAVITQKKSGQEFTADSMAVLGKVNGQNAEIIEEGMSSIRWIEGEFEYKIEGNVSLEEIIELTKTYVKGEVTISEIVSEINADIIEVPVNMEIEENDQKSADAGHSPWRLDPVYVTQVFVSLQISPEGITGDYPVAYEDIDIIENNGKKAIAEIRDEQSPSKKVYLERLIRQDSTGIWTVVGYE